MRHFYEQVQLDKMSMRFYAVCPICGNRRYAGKLPLPCRNKRYIKTLEHGQANPIKQAIYNKYKAFTVLHFAKFFNLCCKCGQWVCDDCYDNHGEEDICIQCKILKGGE